MDGESDSTCRLGNQGTLLEGVINSIEGIILHCQEETGRHLWRWCTRIEQGWSGVSEVALTHQIISFESLWDVFVVDTNCNTHQHVLWSFCNLAIQTQKIGTLEGLESKVIVIVVTGVVDVIVENIGVVHDNFEDFFRNQGRVLAGFWVDVLPQIGDNFSEFILG